MPAWTARSVNISARSREKCSSNICGYGRLIREHGSLMPAQHAPQLIYHPCKQVRPAQGPSSRAEGLTEAEQRGQGPIKVCKGGHAMEMD